MNSTDTPGGSGIPAGWYDDPSGQGLRWWDGEQWTEHVHSAESAAAATGGETAGASGDREGAPPRDLVKLREGIRGRGAKGVGMFLGAVVLAIVVVALLVSGGGSDNGGGFEPGIGVPGNGNPAGPGTGAPGKQAEKLEKEVEKQLKSGRGSKGAKSALKAEEEALKNGKLPKNAKKAVEEEEKVLEKAGDKGVKQQVEAAEKAAEEALKSAE